MTDATLLDAMKTMRTTVGRIGSNGMTLVEVAIAVALIVLILSISIPNIARAIQNADDQKTEKELQNIYTAIVIFQTATGRRPASWAELQPYIWIPDAQNKYQLNAG